MICDNLLRNGCSRPGTSVHVKTLCMKIHHVRHTIVNGWYIWCCHDWVHGLTIRIHYLVRLLTQDAAARLLCVNPIVCGQRCEPHITWSSHTYLTESRWGGDGRMDHCVYWVRVRGSLRLVSILCSRVVAPVQSKKENVQSFINRR